MRFTFEYNDANAPERKSNILAISLQERLLNAKRGVSTKPIIDFNRQSMMTGPGPVTTIKEINEENEEEN